MSPPQPCQSEVRLHVPSWHMLINVLRRCRDLSAMIVLTSSRKSLNNSPFPNGQRLLMMVSQHYWMTFVATKRRILWTVFDESLWITWIWNFWKATILAWNNPQIYILSQYLKAPARTNWPQIEYNCLRWAVIRLLIPWHCWAVKVSGFRLVSDNVRCHWGQHLGTIDSSG